MSEQAPKLEQQPLPSHEQAEQRERVELDPSHELESGLPDPAELAKAAEAHAVSSKEFNPTEVAAQAADTPGLHQELKANSYKKTLASIQHQLSAPERVLSKIVHAKAVEPITNAAASTVGRPSGLLGGAIAALLATVYLLYTAKRYGFAYNYTAFLVFFAGGFVLGVVIEMALKPFTKRKLQ